MNARQRNRLMNLNRVLIFVLTLGGLLLDGFQIADLLCTLSLFVWLWLPLCTFWRSTCCTGSTGSTARPDRPELLHPCNSTNGVSHDRRKS
jgi:hypothetical protein